MPAPPLVAASLSESIAARQSRAYRRCADLRARLMVGQALAVSGRLTVLAATARTDGAPVELTRLRRAALDAGRVTRAAQREKALAGRLRELGFDDLASYLRHARATGVSLRGIAKATGMGWARLGRELVAAGLTAGPPAPHRADQRADGKHVREVVASIAG